MKKRNRLFLISTVFCMAFGQCGSAMAAETEFAEVPQTEFAEVPQANAEEYSEETWAERRKNVLTADTDYELDLDGDGAAETFSFHSEEVQNEENYECYGVLTLSVNGEKVQELTAEGYSYGWTVSQAPLEDGRILLAAWSNMDNDWTGGSPLLEYRDGTFNTLADLAELSRGDQKMVSSWGRLSYVEASAGQLTAYWSDTRYATGILMLPLVYTIEGEKVSDPETLVSLSPRRWTVVIASEVYTEAGSEETAFVPAAGDQLVIDQYLYQDGSVWFHVSSETGEQGWMPDAKEYVSIGEGMGGYFKESIFAG